jgi:hypothetical protein
MSSRRARYAPDVRQSRSAHTGVAARANALPGHAQPLGAAMERHHRGLLAGCALLSGEPAGALA